MRLVAKLLLYIGFFKHIFENQKSGGVRGGLGSRRGGWLEAELRLAGAANSRLGYWGSEFYFILYLYFLTYIHRTGFCR